MAATYTTYTVDLNPTFSDASEIIIDVPQTTLKAKILYDGAGWFSSGVQDELEFELTYSSSEGTWTNKTQSVEVESSGGGIPVVYLEVADGFALYSLADDTVDYTITKILNFRETSTVPAATTANVALTASWSGGDAPSDGATIGVLWDGDSLGTLSCTPSSSYPLEATYSGLTLPADGVASLSVPELTDYSASSSASSTVFVDTSEAYSVDITGSVVYTSTIAPEPTAATGGAEWDAEGMIWEEGIGGNTTVVVDATGNTFPVLTVTGPATSPSVTNITTGQTFAYDGTLVEGQTLVVDMNAQTAYLNGVNVLANVSGDWLYLAPGTNILSYSVTAGESPSATISWNGVVG